MTLDQLRVFVAVAEREHLTQAAAALHLTPSAVSSAIHTLEARYGAHLFDRVGRRIELSKDGRAFLAEARATLAGAAAAERALSELGGLTRGSLALAASQTIVSYWLPPILMRFAAEHSGIGLTVGEGNTTSVAASVLEGRADLGIIEGDIDRPELALTPVDDDRLVVVCAPDHPLVAARQATLKTLAKVPWVMRERGSGTRSVLEDALRAGGIDPGMLEVAIELPTNEAVCAAARAGRCVTAISELVARPHIEAGRLKQVGAALASRHFALLAHKERYRTKAARAFEAMAHEAVREARARREAASFDI